MGIKLIKLIVCLLFVFSLLTLGACYDSKSNRNSSEVSTQYEKENIGDNSTETNIEQHYLISKLNERTSWNIEISFLELSKSGFKIRICDNDNQGFYYNPIYFVLEYKEGNDWKKLTNLNKIYANEDLVVVFPSDKNNYTDTNNVNMFSLVPNFELKNGQYRITKILSGREFSTEFEITGQPS